MNFFFYNKLSEDYLIVYFEVTSETYICVII